MTASTAGGPAREQLRFLDVVRGWALILRVLYLVELRRVPLRWLVVLGQTALVLYWGQEAKRWYCDHGPVRDALGRA